MTYLNFLYICVSVFNLGAMFVEDKNDLDIKI